MSNVNMESPPNSKSVSQALLKRLSSLSNSNKRIQKQPTLMDHTIALRQEVAALRQELHAVAQVTDAVGQAVGQLYQTFLGQSEVTDQSGYYETQEQQADY